MLRVSSGPRYSSIVAVTLLASGGVVLAPAPTSGQEARRARAPVPSVRAASPLAARSPVEVAVPVRSRSTVAAALETRTDRVAGRRDDRRSERRDDRRDDRWDDRRDDGWDDRRDDRWEHVEWRGSRFHARSRDWRRLRTASDLRVLGFLTVDVGWNRWDRADRGWWVHRYDHYDGRGRFHRGVTGWYVPRWGAIRFDRNPLRYGARGLDAGDLRRVLGRRAFNQLAAEVPGRTRDLWGRVERFGPGGRAYTLEIWSRDRFVAALTDFDRDGWVDNVEINGRFRRR